MIYVLIYIFKSELNNKFECKNLFFNLKLQFLVLNRINSKGKINSILKKQMSKSILHH
jgi:hypothetical protein